MISNERYVYTLISLHDDENKECVSCLQQKFTKLKSALYLSLILANADDKNDQ